MNLQLMLDDALVAINAMSSYEFELECHKAGYTPVRKYTFNMLEKSMVDADACVMSYRHSVVIDNYEKVDFSLEPANDSTFQLAA